MANEARLYKPELLQRRGEVIAWGLTSLSWLGVFILRSLDVTLAWVIFFPSLLLLAVLSISLGNWMDRHTLLQMDANGIAFENGLRRVRFAWNEINEVQVVPAIWGETIHVLGAQAHFRFNTLGEVRYRGELRGRTGFSQGREIFQTILRMSALQLRATENGWQRYAR